LKIDFVVAIVFPGCHIPTANLAVKLDAYAAQNTEKNCRLVLVHFPSFYLCVMVTHTQKD
jgi:hypothetical protein